MYVGFGYLNRSEKGVFYRAMGMLGEVGVKINSISLDKYYSNKRTLRTFGKEIAVYVVPKKNLSRIGFNWLKVVEELLRFFINF